MKFKSNIELQAGLEDNNAASGTTGQVLSSTGTGVEWIDQSALTDVQSNFVYFDVKNETGSTINKGKGVMAVGTDGNSGHILIDEMVADGSIEPKYFLGVLETTVANGGFARVISFGQLDQFDTRGQNGETWNNGDILWCDPDSAGDFTITEPDGPNVKIAAAIVLNASTNGKIQVRVQANEGIHDLHDTKIVNQVDGDILVWDNTTGVWFNDSTLNVDQGIGVDITGNLDVSGTITGNGSGLTNVTAGTIDIRQNNNFSGTYELVWQLGDDTLYSSDWLTVTGSTDTVNMPNLNVTTNAGVGGNLDVSGAGTFSGNVGIGTTSPGAKLEVADSFRVSDSSDSFNNRAEIVNATGSGAYFRMYNESEVANVLIRSYGDSHFNGGNVGIGITSPSATLHISDAAISSTTTFSANGRIKMRGDGVLLWGSSAQFGLLSWDTNKAIVGAQTGSALHLGASGNANHMVINTSGNVGIGTTDPEAKLDIQGSGNALQIRRSNGYASIKAHSDNGGNLILDSNSPGAVFINNYVNRPVYIATGGGNVGIGTTSPGTKLDVSGVITATGGNSTEWNAAYGDKINSASFNTSTGFLTLNRQDLGSINVNLDNRYQLLGTYNTIIGTDDDINTSGSTIIDNINVTDGVITSMGTRTLTLGDLGYTGDTNAEVNQNTFSNIAVSGQTTVSADSKTDTLNLAAGSNITITTDAATDTVTINSTGGTGSFTDVQMGASNNIDFSAGDAFFKTLTANTTLTFSNAVLGKTYVVVIDGNFTLTWFTGVDATAGAYDGSSGAVTYYLTCIDDTSGSEVFDIFTVGTVGGGLAIESIGDNHFSLSASSPNNALNYPLNMQDGDLAVLVTYQLNFSSSNTTIPGENIPTGFSLEQNLTYTFTSGIYNYNTRVQILTRTANASDSGNTITLPGGQYWGASIAVFRNASYGFGSLQRANLSSSLTLGAGDVDDYILSGFLSNNSSSDTPSATGVTFSERVDETYINSFRGQTDSASSLNVSENSTSNVATFYAVRVTKL